MSDFSTYRGIEFAALEEIEKIQKELFRKHLAYLSEKSSYYRRTLSGFALESITLDHLAELPFTDKTAFESFNDELLAVPMSEVTDIVLSSGTTGRPTRIMYTEKDLQRLAYNEKISFEGCGITADDIVLLTCTMDRCFVAGLAYFLGVRSLGAATIRNGLSSVASHLEIIQRMDPTVIVGVPSFLYKLGRYMESKSIDPRATAVSKLVCIGEPIRDRQLQLTKIGGYLEELWNARAFSTYASSETITTFCECTAQNGGHLHPDLAIVEVINDQGEVLPPGETGEVVVTTLQIEAMPLLRFRTGDMSFMIEGPCSCGRNSARLGPVLGRKKQMIKFRGTTLYPQAIFSVLDGISGINEYYISLSSDFDLSDILTVHVALSNDSCSAKDIMDRLQAHLRVRPEVIISSDEEVKSVISPANSRKITRFIDRRQK